MEERGVGGELLSGAGFGKMPRRGSEKGVNANTRSNERGSGK